MGRSPPTCGSGASPSTRRWRRRHATPSPATDWKRWAGLAPDRWFLLGLRGSGGKYHAALQEIEACPSVALALDEREPVDLAFGLAATPWLRESSPDGSDVRLQSRGERRNRRSLTGPGLRDPSHDVCSGVLIIGQGLVLPGGAHECGEAAGQAL